MPEDPAPGAHHGLWSRRWFRRLTYVIAAGAVVAGLAAWAITRPELDRWLVGKLDLYARRETGLSFEAAQLEVHPLEGRVLLHQLALGGDLFRARLLEIDLEWSTLLETPHIRRILVEDPTLNLDKGRLGRIHTRPARPGARTPQVLLDRLEIRNGLAQVREPAWGLSHADFRFQVTGTGSGANQLLVRVDMPAISLGQGGDRFQGDLALSANLTDRQVEVKQGQVRLGAQRLAFTGGLHFRERSLSLAASGHLDLAEAQRLASPGNPSTASGLVDFQGKVDGTLDSPAWSGTVQATQLRAKGLLLHPGSLTAAAQGTPSEIRLERLTWASLDGRLQASGNWSARSGYLLQADASAIPLAPVAGYTRAGFLKDLTASFSGVAKLPAGLPDAPWAPSSLESLSFHGTGQFIQDGQRVGGMGVDLERGRFTTPMLDLDLAELEFHGKASGTVGRHGLASVEAEASAATDAADVAGMLMAWDIGMTDDAGKRTALDMSGAARIEAQAGWSAQGGMQLKGRVELQAPRWHGAKGDRLGAGVTIDRDVLRVSDIELDKGDGRAYGELWLTWADLPRGADAIDMWYSGFGLPVREGLKAADLGDLELDGTGNGWVRLHGPFERMLMEGQAEAAEAAVYGLRIPAASADFFMDIDGDLLRVTDLRAADSMAHLGDARQVPDGPLALQGSMEMDTRHETWKVAMRGDVDSRILGLPGPAFQARVDARLDGPLVAPLGPIQMPQGSVSFTQGRLTQGGQQLDGLEGSAAFTGGNLKLSLGLAGKPTRVVTLDARQQGRDRMSGDLELDFGPESADTAKLAAGLTQDFLKDTRFRFHAQGDWTPKGLRWQGQLDPFRGRFEGFSLVQSRPGTFTGDLAGMDVDLAFEGRTSPRPPGPTVPVAATGINLHGRLPFSPGGPLALQLSGSSNLANLKTILDRVLQPGQYSLLADLRTEGSAQFNLNLGGTLAETTLDGTLTLQGGRAVVHGFPLSVEHLDFTAQFKGRDIIIPRSAPLRGTLAQGALTAWGQMTWHLGGVSAYDLHASVEDFQLRDLPDGFDLQGSVDANLKGSDQDGGLLSGSIWAKRTLYTTEINLSDLILANALGGSHLSAADPSDPLARINLDLEVHLAEPWELDTNLLKLQGRAQGPFYIRGTLTKPGLKGRMELLPGGRLTNLFPAGDIVIERGTVDFPDPAVFNPNFDVQGQIDIPPYLVTLEINGALDALQARPFSTPSLRQDEIFAILIDPAAVTQVGGAPGSSSQTLVTTGLAGTSTGLLTSLALANFQEQLRKTLGLDRVSVALRAGTGTPETSVTLGKSVNLFGYRTPLVFTRDKEGEVTTIAGQVEWRFGNFVFRLGASQSTADSLAPSGEIRHSWSPR